jgi:hypothetical protein
MNDSIQFKAQRFSWSRFMVLLKTYLVENSRTLLLYTATLIGLSVFFSAMSAILGFDLEDIKVKGFVEVINVMFDICLYFGIIFSASLTFTSLKTRASRIATFMLPASMLEKFLVRIVVFFPMFVIAYCIAVACGVATWSVICFLKYGEWVRLQLLPEIIEPSTCTLLIGYFLLNQALYTLGSAISPKRAFAKTFVVLLLCIMMLLVVSEFIAVWYTARTMVIQNISLWGFITFIYCLAFVVYWLAWRRFRSTQIVQRFMND